MQNAYIKDNNTKHITENKQNIKETINNTCKTHNGKQSITNKTHNIKHAKRRKKTIHITHEKCISQKKNKNFQPESY